MNENAYEILIVITDGPHILTGWKGASAAVYGVNFPGVNEHGIRSGKAGILTSDSADSDESEAGLLALNQALRECRSDFPVEAMLLQTWICDGINGGAERWQAEGWKDRANKKLWQEYLSICREGQLNVKGIHVAAADGRVAGRVRLFRKWAREARDRKSTELGTPAQPFPPLKPRKSR